MASGGVRSLRLEGFTSIRGAEVQLGDLNVLVGANGSGKSNFIRALELLGRIVDEDLQFFVGVNGGAAALFHQHQRSAAGTLGVWIDAPPNRYEARLVAAPEDRLIFAAEQIMSFAPDGHLEQRAHWRGHSESRLPEVAGRPQNSALAADALRLLAGCRVFHFHDTSVNAPPKRRASTADNLRLRSDGGNLASYLLRLSADGGPAYRQIVTAVRQVAPFFRDFVLEPDTPDTLLLRWRQVGSDAAFSANQEGLTSSG
jgi:predicted ATPase